MATTEVSISDRVNERMEALGLSPAKLAGECGVTEACVRNWMKDASRMYAVNLRKLARALKCSVGYLLGLTNKIA